MRLRQELAFALVSAAASGALAAAGKPSLAGGAAVAGLVALLTARRVALTIEGLAQAAERIASGDYSARVRETAGDQVRVAAALNRLAERMEAAAQLRRDFVANVSHELRTPLTSIRGFAETLREGAAEDPALREEFLGAIERDAQRLSALVDDLLDLAAIESGKARLSLEEVDLLQLAAEAAASLAPLAKKNGVAVRVERPDHLPKVRADPRRVLQVARNLIENAMKFNRPGGSVVISARRGDGELALMVADDGPGIPADALPRIFERFYRADAARCADGTGLGLSIVKHIAEAHRGRAWVESRPGQGACFLVSFPL